MLSIAPKNHTRGIYTSDDWITPKFLRDELGEFELDPCASLTQPWNMAKRCYTIEDDGLKQNWGGAYVFVNPPYGRQTGTWLEKTRQNGNGLALIFARTETRMFFKSVWPHARSLLFIKDRLTFCYPDGTPAPHNSGGPSVLIAYGMRANNCLVRVKHLGALVKSL